MCGAKCRSCTTWRATPTWCTCSMCTRTATTCAWPWSCAVAVSCWIRSHRGASTARRWVSGDQVMQERALVFLSSLAMELCSSGELLNPLSSRGKYNKKVGFRRPYHGGRGSCVPVKPGHGAVQRRTCSHRGPSTARGWVSGDNVTVEEAFVFLALLMHCGPAPPWSCAAAAGCLTRSHRGASTARRWVSGDHVTEGEAFPTTPQGVSLLFLHTVLRPAWSCAAAQWRKTKYR